MRATRRLRLMTWCMILNRNWWKDTRKWWPEWNYCKGRAAGNIWREGRRDRNCEQWATRIGQFAFGSNISSTKDMGPWRVQMWPRNNSYTWWRESTCWYTGRRRHFHRVQIWDRTTPQLGRWSDGRRESRKLVSIFCAGQRRWCRQIRRAVRWGRPSQDQCDAFDRGNCQLDQWANISTRPCHNLTFYWQCRSPTNSTGSCPNCISEWAFWVHMVSCLSSELGPRLWQNKDRRPPLRWRAMDRRPWGVGVELCMVDSRERERKGLSQGILN